MRKPGSAPYGVAILSKLATRALDNLELLRCEISSLLMTAWGVRRDKAALSSGCKSHPATLQPEAAGAAMEVTKWLKPSESVSRIGDSASVQAVTRVNAEQASKRTTRRPTRQPFRGRLTRLGLNERRSTPSRCAGVVATACTQGKRTQHGKPHGVVRATTNWKPARDRPGALGWRRGS